MFSVNDASPGWVDKCHGEAKCNQNLGRELACAPDHCMGELRAARERLAFEVEGIWNIQSSQCCTVTSVETNRTYFTLIKKAPGPRKQTELT